MTQTEKQLLLKDLCARLPYNVQGVNSAGVTSPLIVKGEVDWDILTSLNYIIVKHGWKPYLRPMSSMTEEECKEYYDLCHSEEDIYNHVYYYDTMESIDWLNTHYFDYRGLIEKGIALEAPEGMYNIK